MKSARLALALLVATGWTIPAAARALPGFPQPFVGRWGEDTAGCSAGAVHGGLTISAHAVADGEFEGRVLSVRTGTPRHVQTRERWENTDNLPPRVFTTSYELSGDASRLIVRTLRENGRRVDEKPIPYIACRGHHG